MCEFYYLFFPPPSLRFVTDDIMRQTNPPKSHGARKKEERPCTSPDSPRFRLSGTASSLRLVKYMSDLCAAGCVVAFHVTLTSA